MAPISLSPLRPRLTDSERVKLLSVELQNLFRDTTSFSDSVIQTDLLASRLAEVRKAAVAYTRGELTSKARMNLGKQAVAEIVSKVPRAKRNKILGDAIAQAAEELRQPEKSIRRLFQGVDPNLYNRDTSRSSSRQQGEMSS